MYYSSIFKTNVEIWTMLSSMDNTDEKQEDWITQLEAFVIGHLQDANLTNERIAKHLEMSPTSLYRKMSIHLGMSPNHYIRNIRLKIAHEILSEGKVKTVLEVSYKVGFNRSDYFSKLFEQKYGYRPIDLIKD